MFETSYPDMLTTAAPQQVIAQVNWFLTLLLLWFNSSFRLFKRSELLVRLPDSHVFKLVGWNQSLTGPAVLTAFKLLPHTRCSEQRITQKGPFSDRQIFSRHLQTWKTQSGSFSSSHHTRTKVPPPLLSLSLPRGAQAVFNAIMFAIVICNYSRNKQPDFEAESHTEGSGMWIIMSEGIVSQAQAA